MEKISDKNHWEKVYKRTNLKEVNWFQPIPVSFIDFLSVLNLKPDSKIIDVGGGDSFFVDYLLKKGFEDITVLDISETAINKAKNRLGENASRVNWIVGDVLSFEASEAYDFWHDRAAFHFLREKENIEKYVQVASGSLCEKGLCLMGTFSVNGPDKCSGLDVTKYSEESMCNCFEKYFSKLECRYTDHITISGNAQNFIFCAFQKR